MEYERTSDGKFIYKTDSDGKYTCDHCGKKALASDRPPWSMMSWKHPVTHDLTIWGYCSDRCKAAGLPARILVGGAEGAF